MTSLQQDNIMQEPLSQSQQQSMSLTQIRNEDSPKCNTNNTINNIITTNANINHCPETKTPPTPTTLSSLSSSEILPTQLGDGTADVSKLAVPTLSNVIIDSHARDAVTGGPMTHIKGLGSGDSFLITNFLTPSEADDVLAKLSSSGEHAEFDYQQWYHMVDHKQPHRALEPLRRVKRAMAHPRSSDGAIPHYRFPVNDQERYTQPPPNHELDHDYSPRYATN
jgi:hypothetical protein